jgi:hypothetical protein
MPAVIKAPKPVCWKRAALKSQPAKFSDWLKKGEWVHRPGRSEAQVPEPAAKAVPIMYMSGDGSGVPMRKEELNVARMQYGTFRRKGFFIGSGVIEAGCKNVIGARCKQSACSGANPEPKIF